MLRIIVVSLSAILSACSSSGIREPASLPETVDTIGKNITFSRHRVPEKGLTYYFRQGDSTTAPLVLTLQGSGCNSIYDRDRNGVTFGGLNMEIASYLGSRVSVLAVEKPFVETYSHQDSGSGESCSAEFRQLYTKDNWLSVLKLTVRSVIEANKLHPSRIIVAGHSEGAEVAAFLAGEMPEVTHVLMGGGGGAIQLFEFVVSAVSRAHGDRARETSAVMKTLEGWKSMAQNSDATQPLYKGHAPRYWTTFKSTSPAESLKKSRAKIYIMQGTDDPAAPVESGDLLAAELTVSGRDFIYDRIPGADHGFGINGQSQFTEIWAKALDWAMKDEHL